ncbi:MAG: hypothetical protein QXQ11_09705 [Candidatus Bathyarchaeia archaeon]
MKFTDTMKPVSKFSAPIIVRKIGRYVVTPLKPQFLRNTSIHRIKSPLVRMKLEGKLLLRDLPSTHLAFRRPLCFKTTREDVAPTIRRSDDAVKTAGKPNMSAILPPSKDPEAIPADMNALKKPIPLPTSPLGAISAIAATEVGR